MTGDITAKRVEMVDRGADREERDGCPSSPLPQFWSKGSFERIYWAGDGGGGGG